MEFLLRKNSLSSLYGLRREALRGLGVQPQAVLGKEKGSGEKETPASEVEGFLFPQKSSSAFKRKMR